MAASSIAASGRADGRAWEAEGAGARRVAGVPTAGVSKEVVCMMMSRWKQAADSLRFNLHTRVYPRIFPIKIDDGGYSPL